MNARRHRASSEMENCNDDIANAMHVNALNEGKIIWQALNEI